MKTLLRVLLMSACVFPALAAPDKKPKVIDSYYVDGRGMVCDYEDAFFAIKVLKDGDSIKVHQFNAITEIPVSVETYKVLTDSVQVKWGTQFMFNAEGAISIFENIDLVRGIDEVIKYDDYIQYGSEAAIKEAGKLGVEGKDYVVQDGDIMHFRFNV